MTVFECACIPHPDGPVRWVAVFDGEEKCPLCGKEGTEEEMTEFIEENGILYLPPSWSEVQNDLTAYGYIHPCAHFGCNEPGVIEHFEQGLSSQKVRLCLWHSALEDVGCEVKEEDERFVSPPPSMMEL